MDIPDALKSLTPEKYDFIQVLLHDGPSGTLVKRVAFLDHLLGDTLIAFLHNAQGSGGLTEAKVKKMTLHKKIEALTRLSLDPHATMLRDRIVKGLAPMRDLRNVAAHAAALKSTEADALFANPENRALLKDFPTAFEAAASQVQSLIQDLQKTPAFASTS